MCGQLFGNPGYGWRFRPHHARARREADRWATGRRRRSIGIAISIGAGITFICGGCLSPGSYIAAGQGASQILVFHVF
jgi:hypothetical protein